MFYDPPMESHDQIPSGAGVMAAFRGPALPCLSGHKAFRPSTPFQSRGSLSQNILLSNLEITFAPPFQFKNKSQVAGPTNFKSKNLTFKTPRTLCHVVGSLDDPWQPSHMVVREDARFWTFFPDGYSKFAQQTGPCFRFIAGLERALLVGIKHCCHSTVTGKQSSPNFQQ